MSIVSLFWTYGERIKMDENLENAAQKFEHDLNNAAENAWKPVEESAEQAQAHVEETHEAAQEQVAEAAESVEANWSEVKDEFHQASAETWSAPEIPQTPTPPQPEADRWGAPVTAAADDPGRWNDNLYTPGAEEPAPAEEPKAEEAPKVIDYVATPPTTPAQPVKKDKFPVWAIVLIVLLVLCICIALPIILLAGGFLAFFRNISTFLPTFFI
jgi:cobalamin biosynthesis Mg chelatase CobN